MMYSSRARAERGEVLVEVVKWAWLSVEGVPKVTSYKATIEYSRQHIIVYKKS